MIICGLRLGVKTYPPAIGQAATSAAQEEETPWIKGGLGNAADQDGVLVIDCRNQRTRNDLIPCSLHLSSSKGAPWFDKLTANVDNDSLSQYW